MPRQLVPRTRAGATMTEAGFWGFIRSGLRAKWMRWPPKYHCLATASKKVSGKRHKKEYKCSVCSKWFKQSEVEVDHIIPVGSLKCFKDISGFAERLFCEEDKLRVVCKPCHREITNANRQK